MDRGSCGGQLHLRQVCVNLRGAKASITALKVQERSWIQAGITPPLMQSRLLILILKVPFFICLSFFWFVFSSPQPSAASATAKPVEAMSSAGFG